MARPRKPTQLKVIGGTDRPDRAHEPAVDLPVLSALPPAPDWLPNAHAIKEWDRLGPVLMANGLLTEAGLMTFGHFCALHGQIVRLHAAGMEPTGHLLSQYRGLANDFGLTPVAQGKVKPSGEKPKANAFAGVGKKPGA